MFIVKKTKGETTSLPAKELSPTQLKPITSALAQKILSLLAQTPSYPRALAKTLKLDEQKIYYHIRNLEKANIIEVVKTKQIGGTKANIYKLTQPSFYVTFKQFETTQKIVDLQEEPKKFLEPFIQEGQLNANIIVGSPDPHGPQKARARDGYYGIDLALFLGTFLSYIPNLKVKLDTETHTEDLQQNLILIGGPVTNTVTQKINKKLPIYFDEKDHFNIYSTISKKSYPSDEAGIIVKAKNPFNPKKFLLLVAGKRHAGTRAVMIALLKHFKKIYAGNNHNPKIQAKIVEGIDLDSDGQVDDAEVLE